MIKLNNYIPNKSGQTWIKISESWMRLLPKNASVWMINYIGDMIVVALDGSVHLLDVSTDHVPWIAASRDDFMVKINEGTNAKQWLAIPLIDECVAAGMTLAPGQCYGFKVAPLLGGDYVVENMVPTGLAEHYAAMAKAAGR